MLVRSTTRGEWELLKWIVLLTLASAFLLAFVTSIAGAGDRGRQKSPKLLPDAIDQWAIPMNRPDKMPVTPKADVAVIVWEAIEQQYHERFDDAIDTWSRIRLPAKTDVWRHVALGHAHLSLGELDEAARVLCAADEMQPDNSLVHYYLGQLRLAQAHRASEWLDAMGPSGTVFTAFTPPDVVPNTKGMYRLAAIEELEAAVKLSATLSIDDQLVPSDWPTRAAMPPTVHDLLLATDAGNYIARAHSQLGGLFLERGSLEAAERHMDEAVLGGESVLEGYTELARQYEEMERHADASRAYLKAAQQEANKMLPLRKALENLKNTIL